MLLQFDLWKDIGVMDIVDILLVGVLLFLLYRIVKGTVAIRIFIGILALYLFWKVVQWLQMELLSEILGQFMAVGVIALIVVFQPEIRRFLLLIGNTRLLRRNKTARQLLERIGFAEHQNMQTNIKEVVEACKHMSATRSGALIVLAKESDLSLYSQGGESIDAVLTVQLLKNLFFKNSPLHDGAVIIQSNRIKMAGVVLPVSERKDLGSHLGMRHRAALGITENSDALVVVVSEETGDLSFAKAGNLRTDLNTLELQAILEREFRE